ncbi:MAG: hypothetical protein ACLR6J_04985 [Parabacteroides merdae]
MLRSISVRRPVCDGSIYIGIIVHGLIFGLFFVGGQVYTDNVAPKEMKAQSTGVCSSSRVWGIGFLIRDALGWPRLIGLFRDEG